MIPEDVIRRLKFTVPLLPEVRSRGIELRKSGASWMGLCPFHRESTPSMIVHDYNHGDFFKCFGCDAKGDVIDFVALFEVIPKIQAINRLARDHGISLDSPRQAGPAARYLAELREHAEFWWAERRASLVEILEDASADFFAACEAGGDRTGPGQWAATCGRILRASDALPPEERGQIFLRLRTEEDVRRWRSTQAKEQRLIDTMTEQFNIDPKGFISMIDAWAEKVM